MPSQSTVPNVICERCGTPFHVKPCKIPTARFCSMECRKHRTTLTCEWCGRDFEMFVSRSHQRYCSPACRTRARSGDAWQRVYELLDRSGGPDACWPFMGHRDKNGYGIIKYRNRTMKAYRIACEAAHGELPPGMCACHRCDNPPCCNPAHLFPGTNAENIADRNRKGRTARGERGKSTMTTDHVQQIVELEGTMTKRAIAKAVGVTYPQVCQVLRGDTWTHVTGRKRAA